MAGGERILVAAALAKIIQPVLTREFGDAELEFAESRTEVDRIVAEKLRFDVVVSDLIWTDHTLEFSFDGLDVLDIVRKAGEGAHVIFAAQGYGGDRDYIDEAVQQREVAGIYHKATGPDRLCQAIRIAVRGNRLPVEDFPPGDSPIGIPRINDYFSTRKGMTAAQLAGAIASRWAVNHATLAAEARVAPGTAKRLIEYLGPLIEARGEHVSSLKMTPEVVYRWCGEHAHYILSWCRRNGPPELAGRLTQLPRLLARGGPEEPTRRRPAGRGQRPRVLTSGVGDKAVKYAGGRGPGARVRVIWVEGLNEQFRFPGPGIFRGGGKALLIQGGLNRLPVQGATRSFGRVGQHRRQQ
jgi:DNA-binding NarL/FixJ family response regulator